MIAFKNFLIFLIIFIYQTTGKDEDITDQYITQVNGKLNCRLPGKGKKAFVAISLDPPQSSPTYISQIVSESYGENFSIQGKTKKKQNKKPKLYFHVRHDCFKREGKDSRCIIKIIGVEIPDKYIIEGHGEQVEAWNIGTLDVFKPNSSFQEHCN